jgi:hypothetical protein
MLTIVRGAYLQRARLRSTPTSGIIQHGYGPDQTQGFVRE